MPNLSQVIAETKQSVTRPIILDIVRQIREITKIPTTTPILYADDIGKVYQPGSSIAEDPSEKTLFPLNDKISIEIDEEYDGNTVYNTAVSYVEQAAIFNDKQIGVLIKPVYVSTNISINFKYKTKSKSLAERWRNDIRTRYSMMRDINLHQVSYHYVIPLDFIEILKEIHKLRETYGAYGDSFSKYLTDHSTQRLTDITNQGGNLVQQAIAETQMRIVGYFDFESVPEKIENQEDSDGWIGSFTYKFRYEKPIECNMRFPVMVHNLVINEKYRPTKDAYDIDNQIQNFPLSLGAFNYFEAQLQAEKYVNFKSTLTVPSFDEFIPQSVPTAMTGVFNALCQITLDDLRYLVDLRELGDICLDKDILEFIKKVEYPFITRPYKSILNLSLYRSMALAREDSILLNDDLKVYSTTDLSIRTSHRVRMSIISDLTYVDKAAIDRLKEFPRAFVKILSAVAEGLRNNPQFRDLSGKSRITRDEIRELLSFSANGNPRPRDSGASSNNARDELINLANGAALLRNRIDSAVKGLPANRVNLHTVDSSYIIAINRNNINKF